MNVVSCAFHRRVAQRLSVFETIFYTYLAADIWMCVTALFLSYIFSRCSLYHFYRATRMYSTDYAVASCLSVCLSHASILSKRLYISSTGSTTILVFPYQTGNGAVFNDLEQS